MHFRPLLVTGVALFLSNTARADLLTSSFDAVEADVVARDAALVGDLDQAQKALKKSCTAVLALFAQESTTPAQDAALIRKITGKLVKALPEDEVMADLLLEGLTAFHDEVTGALTAFDKAGHGVSVLDDDNKQEQAAGKALGKAAGLDEAAGTEADLVLRAVLLKKLVKASAKAWKVTTKALAKQELSAHEQAFLFDLSLGYEDAESCIACHTDAGAEVMASGHWNWQGVSTGIEGHETEVHGKQDLINNFCIAVPSNEGRCTQCHVGIGWSSDAFDFGNAAAIDCLVCHDNSGTYAKGLTTAGAPAPGVDLTYAALHVGAPTRNACGSCHFYAGGGDNVKHGDLSSDLGSAPTREMDVHMGVDGGNMTCQSCHVTSNHETAGMSLHSTGAGPVQCTDCHDTGLLPGFSHASHHLENVACQTCHIPAFSRSKPTMVSWLWGDAGQDISPIPTDETGLPTYDKKKGTFDWQLAVEPELRWLNGKWTRMILNVNDTFATQPVNFASPVGEKHVGTSKIHPFKHMVGNQPADAVTHTMLVPHLFGLAGGPNPYWAKYDWQLALVDGTAYAGQAFSGSYEFVDTDMYLSVNHEIAPKEQALSCDDCHDGGIDFTSLGYSGDPAEGGS